jgi:hypothetical protein
MTALFVDLVTLTRVGAAGSVEVTKVVGVPQGTVISVAI